MTTFNRLIVERDRLRNDALKGKSDVLTALHFILDETENLEEVLETAADELFGAWQSAKEAATIDRAIRILQGEDTQ